MATQKKPRVNRQLLKDQREAEEREHKARAQSQVYSSISDIIRTYDLQVRGSFGIYNNQTLLAILEAHNQGQFNLSGLFADDLIADDRISNALTIVKSIISDVWTKETVEFTVYNDGAKARLGWWERNLFKIVDLTVITQAITDKMIMGFGIQQIVYDGNSYDDGPRLVRWHPSQVQYFQPERKFGLITSNQTTEKNGSELITSDAKFQIFSNSNAHNDYYRCWIDGGIKKLGDLFLKKRYALNDWSRFSEIYGNPARKVSMPANASDYQKQDFVDGLRRLSTEGIIPILRDEEGKQLWDIEFLQPDKDSDLVMHNLVDYCNKAIDVAILGTHSITDGESTGAYGATEAILTSIIGAKPRLDIKYLEKDINELISNISEVIFGSKDFAPCITIKTASNKITQE